MMHHFRRIAPQFEFSKITSKRGCEIKLRHGCHTPPPPWFARHTPSYIFVTPCKIIIFGDTMIPQFLDFEPSYPPPPPYLGTTWYPGTEGVVGGGQIFLV